MQVSDESLFLPTKPGRLAGFSPSPPRHKLSPCDLACARLKSAGFLVQVRDAPRVHLRGGRGAREGEIGVLLRPFVVMEEPDGSFFASVERREGGDEDHIAHSLAEAVDFVVDASVR